MGTDCCWVLRRAHAPEQAAGDGGASWSRNALEKGHSVEQSQAVETSISPRPRGLALLEKEIAAVTSQVWSREQRLPDSFCCLLSDQ